MSEEDIKKQLEEKNKEIYLNKLNLDLDNNFEVLVLTIDNLLDNVLRDSTLKVLGIAETFQKEDVINQYIKDFIEKYRLTFMEVLDKKKINIENKFLIEKNIEKYKPFLIEQTKEMLKKIELDSKESIIKLENELIDLFEDKLYKLRIKDYLNNIFLVNLNNKVFDTLKGRDIILFNTFKESYDKYLDLNKKTIWNK